MAAILALENVSKSFGALKVTDSITLSVTEGETLGILGPNGRADDAVQSDQRRLPCRFRPCTFRRGGCDFSSAHRRCRSGIGRSYQIPNPSRDDRVRESGGRRLVRHGNSGKGNLRARGGDPARNRLAGESEPARRQPDFARS